MANNIFTFTSTLDYTEHLIVDLDGTLIRSDTLLEAYIKFIKLSFIKNLFLSMKWLLKGKKYFKEKLSKEVLIDPATLPYSEEVIDCVKEHKENKNKIILCSASHKKQVKLIADYLGIFDDHYGSSLDKNIKGKAKYEFIDKELGIKNFSYIGNSKEDIFLWQKSKIIYFANCNFLLKRRIRKDFSLCIDLTENESFYYQVKKFLKALRVYQWIKNFLVFVPMILASAFNVNNLYESFIAFICISLSASAVYITNDIFDIESDRYHPRKRFRPIANGEISIPVAGVSALLLFVVSAIVSSLNFPLIFLLLILGYILLNILYSSGLKKLNYIALFILSIFYTFRIFAGGIASSIEVSKWLIFFSIFFFLSLSTVKRLGELYNLTISEFEKSERGFKKEDAKKLKVFSLSNATLSCSVLTFYLFSENALLIYENTTFLYLIPLLTFAWFYNLYRSSLSGDLTDDPLIYAVKNPKSLVMGFITIVSFILALI